MLLDSSRRRSKVSWNVHVEQLLLFARLAVDKRLVRRPFALELMHESAFTHGRVSRRDAPRRGEGTLTRRVSRPYATFPDQIID